MDYNCEGVYLKIFTEEELSNERWKPIKNYEDYYEVSSLGRVRSIPRNENNRFSCRKHTKILKLYKNITKRGRASGYRVTLSKNGKTKRFMVHRLVYETFIGNLEENKVINHLDFNPLNNRVDNLEQVTKFENDYYSRGRNSIKLTLNDVEFIRTSNLSNKELSKILGVTTKTITMVRQGRMWKTDQIVYGNIVPSLSNRKEYLEKSHREDLIEGCND